MKAAPLCCAASFARLSLADLFCDKRRISYGLEEQAFDGHWVIHGESRHVGNVLELSCGRCLHLNLVDPGAREETIEIAHVKVGCTHSGYLSADLRGAQPYTVCVCRGPATTRGDGKRT